MTNIQYSQAATELLSRRVAGTKAPRLAKEIRPNSIDDALNIQMAMIEQRNDAVAGWKCLNPPADDKVIVAPIFANDLQQGKHCELMEDNGKARIEPEIAFVLAKDLPAREQAYTEQEIDSAIGECRMALELMQARFAEDSEAEFYERLADCMVNQGLYLGPEIERDKAFTAQEINVSVSQGDKVQQFEGKHPNGIPHSPIYWLINYMTRRGVSFKAGEAIITGSYCGIVEVDFEQLTDISYEGIGRYQVEFNHKV